MATEGPTCPMCLQPIAEADETAVIGGRLIHDGCLPPPRVADDEALPAA